MLRPIVAVVEKRNPTTNPAARKLEPRFCLWPSGTCSPELFRRYRMPGQSGTHP